MRENWSQVTVPLTTNHRICPNPSSQCSCHYWKSDAEQMDTVDLGEQKQSKQIWDKEQQCCHRKRGEWGRGKIQAALPPLQSWGSPQKLLQKQDKPTNNRIHSCSFSVSQATPSTQQQFRVQKTHLFGQLMAGRLRDLSSGSQNLLFGNPIEAPAVLTFIFNITLYLNPNLYAGTLKL